MAALFCPADTCEHQAGSGRVGGLDLDHCPQRVSILLGVTLDMHKVGVE